MTRLAGVVVLASPAPGGRRLLPRPPNAADLEAELVCPVCETTLDQSNAPIAEQMKAFIRVRIAAGDSEQEIKDALVSHSSGPRCSRSRLTAASGFSPGSCRSPRSSQERSSSGFLIRSWSRRRGPPPAGADEHLDPQLERLVDEELARFDS